MSIFRAIELTELTSVIVHVNKIIRLPAFFNLGISVPAIHR